MNKLKTKILLLLSFLFLIILLLGVMGSQFISRLSKDTGEIIKDNYKSMEYLTTMLKALDGLYTFHSEHDLLKRNLVEDDSLSQEHLTRLFETNLMAEEDNLTEAGEEEIFNILKQDYIIFGELLERSGNNNDTASGIQLRDKYEEIRNSITAIYKINSDAILQKNEKAAETGRQISRYMIILTIVSLTIAFISILYFPGYILKPVSELTNKIRGITSGEYDQRLLLPGNDELGILVKEFNRMSSRLKEYEENNLHKLLIEKKRLGTIIDSLKDGIIVIDEKKRIISLNKAAEDITGLKEKDLTGKNIQDITEQYALMREILDGILSKNETQEDQSKKDVPILLGQSNAYYTKEVIETKLNESRDFSDTIGHIIILKNVTMYEERNTAKTNLLATVSHELKTPLSSINLSIKLLEDPRIGDLSEAQYKVTKTIKKETLRLSKMVNELLEYSQTESGNIKLKIGIVSAEEIIDYALTSLMLLISDKKIEIETNIDPFLPPIKADIEKTVWVLVNLITNAVRYTPVNGVLKISCSKDGAYARFSVVDQGQGIEQENLDKIFDKFVQIGDNPRGKGLGLAIAKEFVTSQAGVIWVESRMGFGSTFHFKLPAVENV